MIASLAERGIETRPVFYPVHWMRPYREHNGKYDVAETYAPQGISLPTHGRLNQEQVKYVCEQLVEVVEMELRQGTDVDEFRRAA